MKAISVCNPWASIIVLGVKSVENRGFPIRYRGDLVIQASKREDEYAWSFPPFRAATMRGGLDLADRRGELLGIVELYDCVPFHECQLPLAYGPWCWLIRNPRPFLHPLEFRGALSLFQVPDEIIERAEPVSLDRWHMARDRLLPQGVPEEFRVSRDGRWTGD